jgi:prepilin-type N-terminal cleavage/methylation domain-containing protein
MKKRGFTLLELSVVIAIISLLIGGILAGQDMVRTAELRNIISEYQAIRTGITAFRDKYDGLPGDLRNATDYWGAVSATPSTCYTTIGAGKLTCNGNGDNLIDSADGGTTYSERFRFWQQLVLAELIEGSFTGVSGGGGTTPAQQPVIGTNVPESARNGVGFSTVFVANVATTTTNWFRGTYGNTIQLGTALSSSTAGPGLTPEDANTIDMKFDDGRPAMGMVLAQPASNPSVPNCSTSSNENTANYNLTFVGTACGLIILME